MSNGHELSRADIEDIAVLKEAIPRIDNNVEKIFKLLDGPEGLVTGVALNKQSIKRVWWWLGGVSTTMVGGAIWAIRKAVS